MNLHSQLRAASVQRALDEQRERQPGVFWASSAGYDLRRLAFQFQPAPETPTFDSRMWRLFRLGDMVEDQVRHLLRDNEEDGDHIPIGKHDEPRWSVRIADGGPFPCLSCAGSGLLEKRCGQCDEDGMVDFDRGEVAVREPCQCRECYRCEGAGTLDGWHLVGRLDAYKLQVELPTGGLLHHVNVEIKSMSDFGFRRFVKGDIEPRYLAQAQATMFGATAEGLECRSTCFVAYKKQTSALWTQPYLENPTLQAALIGKHREVARLVDSGVHPLDMPECGGDDYGLDMGKTGNPMNWGCRYCDHWGDCHPNHVAFVGSRGTIQALDASAVPAAAKVTKTGSNVTWRDDWAKPEESEV